MLKLNCLTLFHKVITSQAKIRQIDNSGNNVSHQIELQTVETLYKTFLPTDHTTAVYFVSQLP